MDLGTLLTKVTIDLRTVLAMTVLRLKTCAAYGEWDLLRSSGMVMNTVHREWAYEMEKGGAHPTNGFAFKVDFRRI